MQSESKSGTLSHPAQAIPWDKQQSAESSGTKQHLINDQTVFLQIWHFYL